MKTTKIGFRAKSVAFFFAMVAAMSLFFSCDILEPDPDVLKPTVTITEEKVFVLSNNSAFIDLATKVKTNQPVRLGVTAPPKLGLLSDLGNGLLQYTPSAGKGNATDAFEFTILSQGNQILEVDTVWIEIENDSTDLPCGIFPADDYLYGAKVRSPLTISVLSNDYICAVDSSDLVVSIYRPDNTFPPFYGNAEVKGHAVVYTPGDLFTESDKLIYKVHPEDEPDKAVYGAVFVHADAGQSCDFFLHDDLIYFNTSTMSDVIEVPVLSNDTLCLSINNYTWNVEEQPQYGKAGVTETGFTYQLNELIIVPPSFSDYFLYEVCDGLNCKTARVDLKVYTTADSCELIALRDTMDISNNTIPLIYFDVLYNDQICGDYSTFTITEASHHGTAFVRMEPAGIGYERDPLENRNDSLEYEICNAHKCSRAMVYIRREK